MTRSRSCIVAAFAACLFAGTAGAASITIANPSFENPDQGPGTASSGVPGWSNVSFFGVFNAGEFNQLGTAPDGAQIAYLNVSTGQGWQTLGDTFASATGYQLDFHISSRNAPGISDINVVIFEGMIADASGLNANNIVKLDVFDATDGVVEDQFKPFSVSISAAEVAAAAAVGQPIGIGFFGTQVNGIGNTDAGASDFDLDFIRLNSIPVPEPSVSFMVALGGAVCLRRRRR